MLESVVSPSLEMYHAGKRSGVAAPADLQEACRQFEGLLLGMILKDSLSNPFSDGEEEAGSGMDMFRDFCVEQVADSLAENSSLGIADQLMADVNAVPVKREVDL